MAGWIDERLRCDRRILGCEVVGQNGAFAGLE